MATKTPDPTRVDPKISAPRAETGAANLIIPRRAVLTGTALVLAGSASGCCWPKPTLLRTKFIADFTAMFIGDPTTIPDPAPPPATTSWPDPTRKWPKPGQKQVDIVADYLTFANVLMTVGWVLAPPPTAAPGSLGDQIAQFLQAQNWPVGAPVPPGYEAQQPTVRLVEIAVILDRLVEAINSFNPGGGPGGGPGSWPPH